VGGCERGDVSGPSFNGTTAVEPWKPVAVVPQPSSAKRGYGNQFSRRQRTGGAQPPNCPSDLAAVVTAWPTLPDPIRPAILALVKAASGGGGGR
jgi:hypothetical protein